MSTLVNLVVFYNITVKYVRNIPFNRLYPEFPSLVFRVFFIFCKTACKLQTILQTSILRKILTQEKSFY